VVCVGQRFEHAHRHLSSLVNLSHQRKVFNLALPIMLSNATVPLVGIVDTAVMGRMDSPAFPSAVAIGAALFSIIFWVFGFLKLGTGGLVAQAFGAQRTAAIEATSIRAITIGTLLALVVLLAGPGLLHAGLWAMGGSPDLHALTADYFTVRLWGAPATLVTFAVFGTLVGLQRLRAVFALQLILNLLNITLNLLFFHFTDWHVKGVAAATVISEFVAVAIGLWMIRDVWFTSFFRWQTALKDTQAFITFFNISGNLFIRSLCLTFAFYWITALGSRLGDTTLALNAILFHMLHFTAHALDGFAIAAETLAGNALGRRDRTALWRDVKACTWGALVFSMFFTALFALFGQSFVNTMTTLPEVRELANTYLLWVVLGPLLGVWSFLLDGVYTGTTHTKEMRNGMLISLGLFMVSAEVLLPQFGNHGLWLSYYVLMAARTITLGAWFPRILNAADQPDINRKTTRSSSCS